MDWVHLHLALNHVPVLGSLFVGLLLLCAMFKKSEELKRLSLWWLVVLMLVSIPIKFTGDFADENKPEAIAAESALIKAHEDAADQATTGIFLAGVLAAVALFQARGGKAVPQWGMIASLVLSLVTFALMARTANLGGEIRHTEIRSD
ncbi:MAG: hypothetical protein ACPGVU_08875 [Limisphaerales bacterium]